MGTFKAAWPKTVRLVFVTGTDTGVGKTVLTGLLLAHLRRRGCRALALKPFCSGGRGDAQLLHALQAGDLTLDETNPFHFPEPVAPLAAARKHRQAVPLEQVLRHIAFVAAHRLPVANSPGVKKQTGRRKPAPGHYLLVEGAGGLLVPLGEGYTTLDLIAALECEVIVVSCNRLGTINHTLLTVHALQNAGLGKARPRVAFMGTGRPDLSSRSNAAILEELLSPTPLIPISWLGRRCRTAAGVAQCARSLRASLAKLLE